MCIRDRDYAIELGHTGFFGSLVRGLGVDDEKKEEIRRSIESKNYAELSLILSGIDDSPSAKVLKPVSYTHLVTTFRTSATRWSI